MEDKKCRICGLADMANLNIFHSNTKLVEKLVAVFPIVVYPNDPLPKHICKKCLWSATNMYGEIERAMKHQSKWIANVRSVQPDNHYVKVVDSIEGANKQTALLVSKVAGEDIGERTVCRMFNIKTEDYSIPIKLQNNVKSSSPVVADKVVTAPVKMEEDTDSIASDKKNVPTQEQSVQTVPSKPPSKITQIKSALELNGCTLTKLQPTNKTPVAAEPNKVNEIKVEIKEEPPFYEEFIPCSIQCKMCSFHCETIEELAIHQLDHLTLSVPKLSERRFLDKRIRRGRLIRVEEKKCIRCLNCWRIFMDNKSILHHWSVGDCDFFCQICGKEFASSPKMLREHVPAAHGISYRSAKTLRPPTLTPRKTIKTEPSPQKNELLANKGMKGAVSNESLSVKVACNICMKVFANFKARNSHMRAHKNPPLLPAQPPPSLSDTLLAFNRSNLLPVKDEPQDYDDIPYHIVRSLDTPTPSTSKAISAMPSPKNSVLHPQLHPPPKIIPHRPQKVEFQTGSPAGIRTKYVQIRPTANSFTFKSEPGLSSQALKVKSLIDLQDPSVTSQLPETSDKSSLRTTISIIPPSGNGVCTSNGQPVAAMPKDNMNYGQIFNCHPCGGKFSSKLELFRHKRKCTANNLFPCQFCSRHFLTSADLQMHIMLLHKTSSQ